MVIKKLLLSLSIIGALVISQTASADNRNHRRGYGDFGFNQHSYGSRYRNNRRVNSYHYGSRNRNFRNFRNYNRDYNRHYRGGFNFSYGNRFPRHRRYDSGNFVGGLVLGSLLSYPRYNTRNVETVVYRNAPTTRTREIIYVDSTQNRSTAQPVASGRRLLRDLEGNCFERIVDEQGDEIRVQLEASQCNF